RKVHRLGEETRERVGRWKTPAITVAHVGDEIDGGDHGQAGLHQAGEEPREIPGVTVIGFAMETVETPSLEREDLLVGQHIPNPLPDLRVSPRSHRDVVELPRPFPAGPSPWTSEIGE